MLTRDMWMPMNTRKIYENQIVLKQKDITSDLPKWQRAAGPPKAAATPGALSPALRGSFLSPRTLLLC